MGNLVSCSISLDQSVNNFSQWVGEKVACIHNLKKNLADLETAIADLRAKRNDLSRSLRREEARGQQSLETFQQWRNKVNNLEEEVNELVSAKDLEFQRLCLNGFCSKSLLSSYRYGKSVCITLRKVEKLKSENFEKIADKALTPVVEKLPVQPIIVGQKTMVEEAWEHLMKDEVGIMGMFGMGGVGKTTLLTQINNKFSNFKCEFEFVIWVVVSKELNVEKIQDEIAEKVGLEDWKEKGKHQKKSTIFNFLKEKKFVLFLDDIWEKVDLAEIGVPDPRTQKGCKVAFTTRSQDVCSRMGVEDPMKVQCLKDDEAFELFRKIVGTTTLGSDPNIPALARTVAEKCCGLPLAINVIGETMSCKRTIQEWRHAIRVLDSYAADFVGMEDKILPLLKYSYDSLNGNQVKSCLLYCALYPEDYTISKENLIECWICEGIIDGSEDIEKAVDEGYNIIGILVRSSLLMEGDKDGKAYVRMHDVVREMALWIVSRLGKDKETFIVRAGVRLQDLPKVKNWKVVERMSLMNNMIQHLDGSPKCTRLTTLLLQNANLKNISGEFFKSMPQLAVLDLSANHRLAQLPKGISALVSLRYLNLSFTRIRCIPHGLLRELRKLIHLGLEYTSELESIDGILRLQNLKVLKLFGSGFTWDLKTVKELEALVHLEILTTTMDSSLYIHPYLGSQRLMNCTKSLKIHKVESSELSLPATMGKVRNFSIDSCKIDEIKMGKECRFLSLLEVKISYLTGLWDLTFLMFAPNLVSLAVSHSDLIEGIIKKQEASEVENSGIEPFQNLKKLSLENLPQLKMIYWSPLPFPCLEEITIRECPNLKELPLDSKSGNNGDNRIIIKYSEMEWIEGVEWKDEATKNRFIPSCEKSS